MDFTKEELDLLDQLLPQLSFKIGQSSVLVTLESISEKVKKKLEEFDPPKIPDKQSKK